MTKKLKYIIFLLIISLSLILNFSCNISVQDAFVNSSDNKEEVKQEDNTTPPSTDDKKETEQGGGTTEEEKKPDTGGDKEEDKTPPSKDDNNNPGQDGNTEEGKDPVTPPSTPDDNKEGESGETTEQDKTPTPANPSDPDKDKKPEDGTNPSPSTEGDKPSGEGNKDPNPPSGETGENPTKPPKEENIPSNNPNKDKYNNPKGIPSFPNAITDEKVTKLKAHPAQLDDNYMYIMVRFTGLGNGWKQDEDVYPRGFVLGFNENGQSKDHFVNGFDNTPERNAIPGRGYTKETGFCPDNSGYTFYTNFYCGFEGMRTLIYGSSYIKFQFTNFVIWDQLNDGILGGGFDHPAFVRYPEQNPLKIIVPMESYDPLVHNNVAYFTIYFELLGEGKSAYYAVFDGFEPKE